jgi:hypothetical protein
MKSFKVLSILSILFVALIGISQALPTAETGSISGVVHPTEAMATVEINYDGEPVASTKANPETGAFSIEGLTAGTYTIVITPGSEDYEQKTVSDVSVEEGQELDLGEIHLESNEEW